MQLGKRGGFRIRFLGIFVSCDFVFWYVYPEFPNLYLFRYVILCHVYHSLQYSLYER